MTTNSATERANDPVCLVTGGASGIGLGAVEQLLKQGWNVTVVDMNDAAAQELTESKGPKCIFVKANVAEYDELSAAFAQTWERWKRLDAVFGNAGIGDRISFYAQQPDREDGTPPKPPTQVIDVDLLGPIYSTWLGFHFFRKNPDKAGKIVLTSSMAGIYPGTSIPLYTAAKHGIVGLTRALGHQLQKLGEPITVNCVCPGLVPTNLTKIYSYACPEEHITPVSTVVKAVMGFLEDGKLTGQAAECSAGNIHYRTTPEFSDESAAFIAGEGLQQAMRSGGAKLYK